MERGVYRVIGLPLPATGARCSFPGSGGVRGRGLSFSDSLFLAQQTVGRSVEEERPLSHARSLGKGKVDCGSVFLFLFVLKPSGSGQIDDGRVEWDD